MFWLEEQFLLHLLGLSQFAVGTRSDSLVVLRERDGSAGQLWDVLLDGLYLLHHVVDVLTVVTVQAGLAAPPCTSPDLPSHCRARADRLAAQSSTLLWKYRRTGNVCLHLSFVFLLAGGMLLLVLLVFPTSDSRLFNFFGFFGFSFRPLGAEESKERKIRKTSN